MRCWVLRSLLLLSVLFHEAQGIRLIRIGTPTDDHHIKHKTLQGRSNDGIGEAILCIGIHCSGRVRNLSENTISSTTTAIKNQNAKNKEKKWATEENLAVDSSSEQHLQPAAAAAAAAAAESYPGVLDIAGMDYSQARRKPPIHN